MGRNPAMDALFAAMMADAMKNTQQTGSKNTAPTTGKIPQLEGAKKVKELHDVYMQVGFSNDQAFQLVLALVTSFGRI